MATLTGATTLTERMNNRGFETGDFTNWTADGIWSIQSGQKRSGTYSAMAYGTGDLYQTGHNVAQSLIDEFYFYTYQTGGVGDPPSFNAVIIYTDETETVVPCQNAAADQWEKHDLEGSVTVGKSVAGIRIEYDNSQWNSYFDDFSLVENVYSELTFDVWDWVEEQSCHFPIKPIPKRAAGAKVDTGTYTLKNRKIRLIVRLTTTEKTTLQTLFDDHNMATLTIGGWSYTVYFTRKPTVWEYKKINGEVREWNAELFFVCSTFSYS